MYAQISLTNSTTEVLWCMYLSRCMHASSPAYLIILGLVFRIVLGEKNISVLIKLLWEPR
jgi:hypothetical protein